MPGTELGDDPGRGNAADQVAAGLLEVERAERAGGDTLRAATDCELEGSNDPGRGDAADLVAARKGEPQRPVGAAGDALWIPDAL